MADTITHTLTHPAAYIIWTWLLELGYVVSPAGNPTPRWSGFVGRLPDEGDEIVGIFDIGGISEGRLQRGATIYHPGVQVLVRSKTYLEGYTKIIDIAKKFEEVGVNQATIDLTIGVTSYKLCAIHRTAEPLPLGNITASKGSGTGVQSAERPGTEKSRGGREVFSLNTIATIVEVL